MTEKVGSPGRKRPESPPRAGPSCWVPAPAPGSAAPPHPHKEPDGRSPAVHSDGREGNRAAARCGPPFPTGICANVGGKKCPVPVPPPRSFFFPAGARAARSPRLPVLPAAEPAVLQDLLVRGLGGGGEAPKVC